MTALTPTSGAPPADLERLRNTQATSLEAEKARLGKATKEFESFFLYYMLKTMRETLTNDASAEQTPLGGGMGKDTYQQMFDMEISRHVVRGDNRSLSAILYKSMEKLVEARYKATENGSGAAGTTGAGKLTKHSPPIPLKESNSGINLPLDHNFRPVERSTKPAFSPITLHRRIKTVDPIKSQFGEIIAEAAHESKLDSALIQSVIKAESNGDPNAISRAGAKGLMQLADSTALDLGVVNPFDPRANVLGGARYLRNLIDRYKGDLRLALAAYNAGPGTVERHGGVPPFRETHDYIRRVTDYLKESAVGELGPLK
jgi:Rod binding domain-containing protein